MRQFILVLAFLFVGCGVQTTVTTPKSTKSHRLQIVDHQERDGWHWKIVRDTETGKEWLVVHDMQRVMISPVDRDKNEDR